MGVGHPQWSKGRVDPTLLKTMQSQLKDFLRAYLLFFSHNRILKTQQYDSATNEDVRFTLISCSKYLEKPWLGFPRLEA